MPRGFLAIILRKLPDIQDIVHLIHDLSLNAFWGRRVAALHSWGQGLDKSL